MINFPTCVLSALWFYGFIHSEFFGYENRRGKQNRHWKKHEGAWRKCIVYIVSPQSEHRYKQLQKLIQTYDPTSAMNTVIYVGCPILSRSFSFLWAWDLQWPSPCRGGEFGVPTRIRNRNPRVEYEYACCVTSMLPYTYVTYPSFDVITEHEGHLALSSSLVLLSSAW